jgi:hypothetical protein
MDYQDYMFFLKRLEAKTKKFKKLQAKSKKLKATSATPSTSQSTTAKSKLADTIPEAPRKDRDLRGRLEFSRIHRTVKLIRTKSQEKQKAALRLPSDGNIQAPGHAAPCSYRTGSQDDEAAGGGQGLEEGLRMQDLERPFPDPPMQLSDSGPSTIYSGSSASSVADTEMQDVNNEAVLVFATRGETSVPGDSWKETQESSDAMGMVLDSRGNGQSPSGRRMAVSSSSQTSMPDLRRLSLGP